MHLDYWPPGLSLFKKPSNGRLVSYKELEWDETWQDWSLAKQNVSGDTFGFLATRGLSLFCKRNNKVLRHYYNGSK